MAKHEYSQYYLKNIKKFNKDMDGISDDFITGMCCGVISTMLRCYYEQMRNLEVGNLIYRHELDMLKDRRSILIANGFIPQEDYDRHTNIIIKYQMTNKYKDNEEVKEGE